MRLVLRIGGSILGSPPRPEMVRAYADVVRTLRQRKHEVGIVVGGGQLSRDYIHIAKGVGLAKQEQDELAIAASRLNAALFMKVLEIRARVPTTISTFARILRRTGVAVMGGLKPGMTTDNVAALLVRQLHAELLVKATDQEGIYTADPRRDPRARKLEHLSFPELASLLGGGYEPGLHRILDPLAVDTLKASDARVVVMNGTRPQDVLRVVDGTRIGTLIDSG